ncbi:MAG: hypothetical protein ACR2HY_02785 [Acidimicrobiales bacterium]
MSSQQAPRPRRNTRKPSRGPQGGGTNRAELWQRAPEAAVAPPIIPAADPTALLRSLGRPPLDVPGADEYLALVIDRASGLATALAAAAGILSSPED